MLIIQRFGLNNIFLIKAVVHAETLNKKFTLILQQLMLLLQFLLICLNMLLLRTHNLHVIYEISEALFNRGSQSTWQCGKTIEILERLVS